MKILIKDSTGDLIPISIKYEDTFYDLNKRMEKEYGIHLNFDNLQNDNSMDLMDQNILTYLSDNNQQAAIDSDNYSQKSALSKQRGKESLDKMQIETTATASNPISLEEIVQIIPEGYHLVTLNPELEEEFCEGIGKMKSEEIEITEKVETTNIRLALVSENHDIQRSEKIFKFSKSVFGLNNDITSSQLVCRLCATRGNDMVYMFGNNKTYNNIIGMIEQCLTIVVKKSDNLPKQACRSCLERLELCYQFHKTVTEAEKQLLMLNGKIFHQTKKKEKLQQDSTKLDENRVIVKTIINEELQIMDTIEENVIDSSDLERILKSQVCSVKELRFDKNDYSEKIVTSNKVVDEKYEKHNTIDNIIIEKEIVKNETFVDQKIDCKLIKCRICGEGFKTVKKCHIHSSVHALENYYPCSQCDKTFTNEKDSNVHNTEHTESKKFERRAATHVCKECGKKFVTEARLQFHKIYHNSDTKPCYCKKCDKIMASESSLYQHMLTVHRQYKEYCCDICGNQFRAQAQLSAHQRKHKDERPFECEICNKTFYSNDILRRHKKLHLPDKPYQCDQCGKRFDRNNTLTKHLLRHQVEAGQSMICHICNICKEVFANTAIAKIHLKDCAMITKDNNQDNKIVELNLKETYRCEYCEKCYTEIEFMKNHRLCHSEPSPYICTVCDTAYATYNQATAHKTAHKKYHKIISVKDELLIPRYFVCEYCDKQFLHFTNMNIHRRSCLNGKIWTCRYCGAVFENARELSRHKKGEINEETWLCNECNNSYGSECALEIHRDTHSTLVKDKKNFSCLHCGKIFNQKAHLTIHIRSHTGERPYNCDLCDKAYKIKTERDNHQRTHSGEKPFKCTICEKTFANTARLREHTRFHSGKRPYNCSLCNQSFKKANARNVHMTIHTGEKPYQCDVCGTHFRRTGDMRKHKRTQHGQKLETKNETNYEIDSKIYDAL